MALRVYGIVMQDGQGMKLPPEVKLHAVREIAAVTEEGDFSPRDVDKTVVERHLTVVENLFGQDAVLPTPVGTVFRSSEALQRWMELHYVALSDALAWVEDRVASRLHISAAVKTGDGREPSSDLAAIAAEVSRSLRRRAVAGVPLRTDEDGKELLNAAFLVERELWQEFADAVGDEQERHPLLRIELTGPWPPYDFVRLQFGA